MCILASNSKINTNLYIYFRKKFNNNFILGLNSMKNFKTQTPFNDLINITRTLVVSEQDGINNGYLYDAKIKDQQRSITFKKLTTFKFLFNHK